MTPKTLDKYIAALKKKAAAEGWTQEQYEQELNKIQGEMAVQYLDNKITGDEYAKVSKQLDNAMKNMALQGKKNDQFMASVNQALKTQKAAQAAVGLAPAGQKQPPQETLQDKIDKLKGELQAQHDAGLIKDSSNDTLTDLLKMAQKDLDNGATEEEVNNTLKSVSNALAKHAAAQPVSQTGMSHDEYINLWESLNKKKKAGLITQDEYYQLGTKLDKAYKDKKSLQDAQKEIGCDPGTLATDDQVIKLEKEIRKVYGDAAKEMKGQLKELQDYFNKALPEMTSKLYDGEISQAEYDKWVQMQVLQKDIVKQKIDQLSGTMLEANKKALGMVNGDQVSVFADNANWQSYQLTQDAGMNLMFSVYDESTARKLLKDKPELLPRKEVNGKKDKAWNRKQISSAVLQAVIQGSDIRSLARRIADATASTNMKAMVRYARTAMTGAQNAGRMEMLHRAQGIGIKVRKTWLATLDSRTRDSHQHLDGVTVGVDEEFPNKLMFPGDPNGAPGEVYNCRCTLIYEYDGFPADPAADQRRDQTTGQMIMNMTYDEWKAATKASQLNTLNYAKSQLAEAQKKVVAAKIDESKVYSGIWKDDVTLKDYPDKKDSIKAKRDYYDTEIQKYKDAQAEGKIWATDDKIKDLQKKLKALNDFDKKGQLIEARDKAIQAVQDVYQKVGFGQTAKAPSVMQTAKKAQNKAKKAAVSKNGGNAAQAPAQGQNVPQAKPGTPFSPDAYSQERKDKALWTTSRKKVDDMMRARTGEVWEKATDAEKDAIYEYTRSYNKFNEPLRGIEYGSSKYKGVGKTDLNADYQNNGTRLNAMTDIIDKCSYDHDQWFQRGCSYRGMDNFFQCSESLLRNGTQKELENELLGKTVTEYGFMSMGSAKGKGFSGNIMMNIYAPSGTKMMYVEPFSAYSGASYNGKDWDGKKTQSVFGSEFETIMQQGTQFRVSKVERTAGTLYVDIEVIGQDKQQRWKK